MENLSKFLEIRKIKRIKFDGTCPYCGIKIEIPNCNICTHKNEIKDEYISNLCDFCSHPIPELICQNCNTNLFGMG